MILVTAPVVAACRSPYQDAALVQFVQPAYPQSARELGLGVVNAKVVVTLSPTGTLISASIYQSAGNMSLDQAALSAARQSTFSPKIVNCEPVTGDYLLSVTFDPKGSPSPTKGLSPAATPQISAGQTCQIAAMTASQQFGVLQQRRDYARAFQAAASAAQMQANCAAQFKTSPQRFSMEMLAGSTLSRAADLAYSLGRYQQARDFAKKANAIYGDLLAPSIDQNYGRFLTPNAKANVQANVDLLKRIDRQEQCTGVSAPISSLVLKQMPSGSSVNSIGVAGDYAVAISFGPGGYAVRSFLLIKHKAWTILTSEGGAFDLATYRHNGVPSEVAAKLAAMAACGPGL